MESTVELCNKVGKDDCKINCFEDLEYNKTTTNSQGLLQEET